MQPTLVETATYPRLTTTEDVGAACAARPDVAPFARLVGRWVWCEFPDKPSADTRDFLKGTGFRWNKTRAAWQHPCGHFTRQARGYDPRSKYGQLPIGADYVTRDQAGPAPDAFRRRDRISEELNNFQAI
jgi:hypothetical protein